MNKFLHSLIIPLAAFSFAVFFVFQVGVSSAQIPVSPISISPAQTTIASGESVKFNLTFPANVTSANLYIMCPSGGGVSTHTNPELCNTYVPVTSNTDWTLMLFNSSAQIQYVAVVYNVATSNGGSYSQQANVAVKPVSVSSFTSVSLSATPADVVGDSPTAYVIQEGSIRSFSFTVSCSNSDAYINRSQNIGMKEPLITDISPTNIMAGDTSTTYVVPAGTSRSFQFTVNNVGTGRILSIERQPSVVGNCVSATTPVTEFVKLLVKPTYSNNNQTIGIWAGIKADPANANVSWWTLDIACTQGVTMKDPSLKELCNTQQTYYASNIYGHVITEDYPMLTIDAVNNGNTTNANVTFVLTAHEAEGIYGSDSKILNFGPQATPTCYEFGINLKLRDGGVRNPDNIQNVMALQRFLIRKGFQTEVTGYFGGQTLEAVKKYQRSVGIPATGEFDPATRAKANSDCGTTPSSYPGFFMKLDKDSYLPNEKVTLTMSRTDGLASGYPVDVYFVGLKENWTKMKSNFSVGQGTVLTFKAKEQDTYTVPGSYKIIICNAGHVCDGGHTTNGIVLNIVDRNNPTNLPPVISSITGPSSLGTNKAGTWTVNASDPEKGPLNYSVDWGDYVCPPNFVCVSSVSTASQPVVQSSTFTHTYSTAGTYNIVFKVYDNAGNVKDGAASVKVAGQLIPISSSITITNPHERDVYDNGPTQNIIVSWNAKDVVADYFSVNLANIYTNPQGTGLSVGADNVPMSSNGAVFQPTEQLINGMVANSGGKTRDQIKDGYYVFVEARKDFGNGNSSLVTKGKSGIFTISSVATPPSGNVTEKIGCVFTGSTKQETCYTVGQNQYLSSGCTGVGRCVADASGPKGSQLTWKSSCSGDQVVNTTMDAKNEYALFTCSTVTPVALANIVAALDPASPQNRTVQVSSSAQTNNVVLGIFDLKSQNRDSTLRSLRLVANVSTPGVTNVFSNIKIQIAGLTYFPLAISASNGSVAFADLSVPLPKDVNLQLRVLGDVVQDTNGTLNGATASIRLEANSTNVYAEDTSFNQASVTSGSFASNVTTFISSSAAQTQPVVSGFTSRITSQPTGTNGILTSLGFEFSFVITAGESTIYVPNDAYKLITLSTVGFGSLASTTWSGSGTVAITPDPSSLAGDDATTKNVYVIPAGGSRKFTVNGRSDNTNGTGSAKSVSIVAISYGTDNNSPQTSSITQGLTQLRITAYRAGSSVLAAVWDSLQIILGSWR